LIRDFDRVETRPPAGFEISTEQRGDVVHPSIVAPVPSRMVWPLPLPRRGAFRAFVALAAEGTGQPARLRVGVSDHRVYEGLAEVMVPPGDSRWIELRADLSAYAGWKWSLFYQPDRVTWRIVLAADATGAAPARAVWGSPEILTDTDSALEYTARRRQLAGR
jgi:hypothetical protein